MTYGNSQNFVLSIYPFSRGFAFVLFEGPESPFDWGVKEIKRKHKDTKTLDEIKRIVDRYRPEVLVIEDTTGTDSRRTSRIRKLYRMLVHFAEAEYVDLHRCSKSEVKACFAAVGASTKYEIAKAIATQIPAFAHRIPRRREIWMSEDPRQSLFDAAALGLTYFARGIPSCYSDDVSS
jgi:RNase H-fold protein (predicted Holliday junction resolvase)